jgi:hypothetical protein
MICYNNFLNGHNGIRRIILVHKTANSLKISSYLYGKEAS